MYLDNNSLISEAGRALASSKPDDIIRIMDRMATVTEISQLSQLMAIEIQAEDYEPGASFQDAGEKRELLVKGKVRIAAENKLIELINKLGNG